MSSPACGPAMGLIDIQFIETTMWFPNKKDNLTVQKRHNEEYKARLTSSKGGFPASAPIVKRKNSVAGCELSMLSVSKPDSSLHERPGRERDGAHVSSNEGICFLCVRVASSSHRSERSFRLLTSSSNMSSSFGRRHYPNIISHRFRLNYTCGVCRSFN